jgi:hypothetical protein
MLKLSLNLNLRQPIIVNFNHKIDRTATNLAILDVFLGFDRTIHQQRDFFPAVRALQRYLYQLIDHCSGSMRRMRPLSVEK